jgi:hypothetical protein
MRLMADLRSLGRMAGRIHRRVLVGSSMLGLAAIVAALAGGSAAAAVPSSIQGTFTRHFTYSDFPNSEEPTGVYTMKITPLGVVWSAKGIGFAIEQAKTSGTLLLVRDKPGSLGRLCAQNGWGTYRYTVKGTTVSFTKIKDPCKQRGEVLGKTWVRKH